MTPEVTTPHTEANNADYKPQRNPKKLASILMSGAAGIASVLYFGPITVLGAMVTTLGIAVTILIPLALVMIAAIVSGYEKNLEKMSERPVQLLITIVVWILLPAAVGIMVAQFSFLILLASSLP